MMKTIKLLCLMVFFALLSGAAFFVWADSQIVTPRPLAKAVEVMIPKGTGVQQTAAILADNGVIAHKELFVIYLRMRGLAGQIKAGEYAFSGAISPRDVAQKLCKGDVIVRSLTIPEGKTLYEIKKLVAENPYLAGEITLSLQEGEILPETYHFTRGEQRNAFLQKARQAMKKELQNIFAAREENGFIRTPEDLLILASLVEKETGVGTERAKVASVFYNRLKIGMRLQTDPTVIYAVTGGTMNLGRSLYKKDLTYDSPYNTYLYAGLPPKPICSPGKASLQAVAHPAKTAYLYFVADGESGGHRFATTLSEHNHNVALYRQKH
jgi:UPF0755 protein